MQCGSLVLPDPQRGRDDNQDQDLAEQESSYWSPLQEVAEAVEETNDREGAGVQNGDGVAHHARNDQAATFSAQYGHQDEGQRKEQAGPQQVKREDGFVGQVQLCYGDDRVVLDHLLRPQSKSNTWTGDKTTQQQRLKYANQSTSGFHKIALLRPISVSHFWKKSPWFRTRAFTDYC